MWKKIQNLGVLSELHEVLGTGTFGSQLLPWVLSSH